MTVIAQQRRQKLSQQPHVCWAWQVTAGALWDRGPGPDQREGQGQHLWGCEGQVGVRQRTRMCVCLCIIHMCVCKHACVCACACQCAVYRFVRTYVCSWTLRQHSRYKCGWQLSPSLCRTLPRPRGCRWDTNPAHRGLTGPHSWAVFPKVESLWLLFAP